VPIISEKPSVISIGLSLLKARACRIRILHHLEKIVIFQSFSGFLSISFSNIPQKNFSVEMEKRRISPSSEMEANSR
jgi:hypothetical protein